MISAKVVADSKNTFGNRLTTLLVTMPRYILAEFNTHRMLSKNSASSRAIPFEKMVKMVQENPFIPIAWQKDHKGMQGTEYLDDLTANDIDPLLRNDIKAKEILQGTWAGGKYEDPDGSAVYHAVKSAEKLHKLGVTKQFCNRLLEPFMWHTVLVSATEWQNFFHLRCPSYTFHKDEEKNDFIFKSRKDAIKHFGEEETVDYETGKVLLKDLSEIQWLKTNQGMADIHMMATAEAIWDAINESTPKELKVGDWHIPFGDDLDDAIINSMPGDYSRTMIKVMIATARAARTSYTTVDSEDLPNSIEQYYKDTELHNKLLKSGHWSPFEHCAKAMSQQEMYVVCRHQGMMFSENLPEDSIVHGMLGNFRGFIQYRKMFNNENVTK